MATLGTCGVTPPTHSKWLSFHSHQPPPPPPRVVQKRHGACNTQVPTTAGQATSPAAPVANRHLNSALITAPPPCTSALLALAVQCPGSSWLTKQKHWGQVCMGRMAMARSSFWGTVRREFLRRLFCFALPQASAGYRRSPRCTQVVPAWHLAGQLAGTDCFNARARRATRKTGSVFAGCGGFGLLNNGGKSIFETMGQAGMTAGGMRRTGTSPPPPPCPSPPPGGEPSLGP